MVHVGDKPVTARSAMARGRVFMHGKTLDLLLAGGHPKGDAIAAAHLAGVMAAKRTHELIPLAHPLALDGVEMAFAPDRETSSVAIEARGGRGARPAAGVRVGGNTDVSERRRDPDRAQGLRARATRRRRHALSRAPVVRHRLHDTLGGLCGGNQGG
jgi:molybdenum cofactor biosynthesis protein MoaC